MEEWIPVVPLYAPINIAFSILSSFSFLHSLPKISQLSLVFRVHGLGFQGLGLGFMDNSFKIWVEWRWISTNAVLQHHC